MNDTIKFWEDLKSGKFVSMVKEASKGRHLQNPSEVYNVMKPMFAEKDDVESLSCIYLDAKNKIIAIKRMFSGSISSSTIYPREIVKAILKLKATALIMIHNHPSGSTEPSSEDLMITIKVGIALASIDTSLHDHIVIGHGYHSMAETGWLRKVRNRFDEYLSTQSI